MCLSSTQPLHSAASGIVGKLHRLLKIEQAATLRAIFLLGRGVGGAGEQGGGRVAQGTFHGENKLN